MNLLAALAELSGDSSEDRNVADTVIEEFPERMGELANYMTEIYKDAFNDLVLTILKAWW